MPKDLSRPWEDPLAEAGERQLAQGLRGTNLSAPEVPEWKQKAMGKAPTLGVKDVRPIKDQRESLPIFLLRDELIQAVHANQVLVVIGETGGPCFLFALSSQSNRAVHLQKISTHSFCMHLFVEASLKTEREIYWGRIHV